MGLALGTARITPVSGWYHRAYDGRLPQPFSPKHSHESGGRYNRPGTFPVLYASSTLDGALAELEVRPEARNRWFRYTLVCVWLEHVLRLDDPDTRAAQGLTEDELRAGDREVCNAIGYAAYAAGLDGILAPSAARRDSLTLAIFYERGVKPPKRVAFYPPTILDEAPLFLFDPARRFSFNRSS